MGKVEKLQKVLEDLHMIDVAKSEPEASNRALIDLLKEAGAREKLLEGLLGEMETFLGECLELCTGPDCGCKERELLPKIKAALNHESEEKDG